MALLTVTQIITEISRRVGRRPELEAVGGPIERAINDAYLQAVLQHEHKEFEAVPPFFFTNAFVVGTDGTNAASGDTFTTTNASVPALAARLVGGFFSFDDESNGHTIVRVQVNTPIAGTNTITVAPAIQVAHTAQPFKLFVNRYPTPTDPASGKPIFFIFDIADITNNIKMRAVDYRAFDRSVPLVGQATMYDRINNEIVLHPAPYQLLGATNGLVQFKMRAAIRPDYKSAAETLDPLPEEWQEVVISSAQAILLETSLYQVERAGAIRAAAAAMADRLKKPAIEETDDQYPALKPRDFSW